MRSWRQPLGVLTAAVGVAVLGWLMVPPRARVETPVAPAAESGTGSVPAKTEVFPTAIAMAAGTTANPAPESLVPARYDVPSAAESYRRAVRLGGDLAAALPNWREGEVVDLPLPDGRVLRGRVNLARLEPDDQRLVGGELLGEVAGSFSLGVADGRLGGTILPAAGVLAYTIETGRDGAAYLLEKLKASVVCLEFPQAAAAAEPVRGEGTGETTVVAAAGAPEFSLSSRPTAAAVAYLDFDGESVTDVLWNGGATIDATPAGLTAAQITDVWRRVAEDYRAFDVDVTTDRARYDAAPVKSRMRCIVTQNSAWYGGAGGVAYISSWRQAGSGSFSGTIPCWVFANMLQTNPRYVAEACSHELGHTLGLSHDGLKDGAGTTIGSYYSGHGGGATGWAPIMGVGYYQPLVHWSKGEYVNGANSANNTEDDLAIITSAANHVAYIADDAAATVGESAALRFGGATAVNTIGTISRSGEIDAYRFTTGGGLVSFDFALEAGGDEAVALPDLDASATLYDLAGNVLAQANPTGSLFPVLSAALPAGTYVLALQGVGEGDPTTGYSNYGSLGRYQITGTVPAPAGQVPSIGGLAQATALAGTTFSYQIEATAGTTSYGASGLPAGLSVNPGTGLITGTPTATGPFSVTLSATNAAGTGTRVVEFDITVAVGLAVEAPGIAWSLGGTANWYEDTANFQVGASSARSGAIANSKDSWIEATLTGPGVLTFWWKVSSQSGGDYLRLRLDGVEQAAISGTVAWTQRTLDIPAGTHAVRWVYAKNASGVSGSDAGWLDGVSFAKAVVAPAITSPASARGVIGAAFNFQVTASNSPTGYTVSGLPAGLTIDAGTGLISGTIQPGTAAGIFPVNVGATNAGGTGSAVLNLDVQSGFTAWAQDSSLSGAAALAAADPDGDGVANLLEYAFARSALVAETPVLGLPQTTLVDDSGTPRLEVVFTLPENRPDLVYTVQVSSDLATWEPGHAYGAGVVNSATGLPTQEVSRTTVAAGQQVVVRDLAGAGAARRFVRVIVSTQ